MEKVEVKDSLVEMIKGLGEDIEASKRIDRELNREVISKKQEEKLYNSRLKEFYEEDDFAKEVASRKKSYGKWANRIEKKYESLLGRIFPKINEKFDGEVERVIKSMNNVGVDNVCMDFTTKGIKRYVNKETIYALFIGALFGGALLVRNSLRLPEMQDVEPISLLEKVKYILPAFIVSHSLFMLNANSYIKDNINKLKKTAKKTDDFLKKHYIK